MAPEFVLLPAGCESSLAGVDFKAPVWQVASSATPDELRECGSGPKSYKGRPVEMTHVRSCAALALSTCRSVGDARSCPELGRSEPTWAKFSLKLTRFGPIMASSEFGHILPNCDPKLTRFSQSQPKLAEIAQSWPRRPHGQRRMRRCAFAAARCRWRPISSRCAFGSLRIVCYRIAVTAASEMPIMAGGRKAPESSRTESRHASRPGRLSTTIRASPEVVKHHARGAFANHPNAARLPAAEDSSACCIQSRAGGDEIRRTGAC